MSFRRLLIVVTGAALVAHVARRSGLLCLTRRGHDPVRRPWHGFECTVCGRLGVDLDAYHWGEGYVMPTRTYYDRENGTLTRTSEWEEESDLEKWSDDKVKH